MSAAKIRNIVAFLSGLSAVGSADAHSFGGDLGQPAKATDLYEVTCSAFGTGGAPTDHVVARIVDEPAATEGGPTRPILSIQVLKGRAASSSADIGPDGDDRPSRFVKVVGGNGVYYLMVNKTTRGAESYHFEYHCQSITGAHTDTRIFQTQNQ